MAYVGRAKAMAFIRISFPPFVGHRADHPLILHFGSLMSSGIPSRFPFHLHYQFLVLFLFLAL